MITICPRCRAPHDSRRTVAADGDPLLLTGGARLCEACSPAVSEPSPTAQPAGRRSHQVAGPSSPTTSTDSVNPRAA